MSSGPRVGYVRRACTVLVALVLGALSVLVAGPVALAGVGLTTTAPTTSLVPPGATTSLVGAGVSGVDDGTRLQVTVSADRGTLSVEPGRTSSSPSGTRGRVRPRSPSPGSAGTSTPRSPR